MLYMDCFYEGAKEPITSEGYVYQGKPEINMSSIWTKLIKEAARFCDCYASDLIIDIDNIRESMKKQESRDFYLAFRDMGIDNNSYIECRTPNECRQYRAIWKLSIRFEKSSYYDIKITAKLCDVIYSYFDHDFKKMMEEK